MIVADFSTLNSKTVQAPSMRKNEVTTALIQLKLYLLLLHIQYIVKCKQVLESLMSRMLYTNKNKTVDQVTSPENTQLK